MEGKRPIRVLIIDDSVVIRQLLKDILTRDGGIEVVGTASDPVEGYDKLVQLQPDVLTLDVEMPRMDGITFLEKLMRSHPMPVVMISTLTREGSEVTLKALELGAVDFIAKPTQSIFTGMAALAHEITTKVKAAARARVRPKQAHVAPVEMPQVALQRATATGRLIAIGASTGGPEAIRQVLQGLPAQVPPIVIVQHMPPVFTRSFAERLDRLCTVRVKEAEDGDTLQPGHAYIAPGDYHLQVSRNGSQYRARVVQTEPVNRHRPSVDALFDSVVEASGAATVAVLLTGMGADGARGMKKLRDAGARTIAQDEETCVVFGMPREAIQLGGAEFVLPLPQIAHKVVELVAS
ncbi:MAG: chemotaxis response regulator protein-glutamate methylesterase [Armatimonadota bacterium]|nr:chemotaxis response regulator protein-glutamate methylesterase [bacterium]MCS7309276.1 chemotaxis response regulator protein-glutamate methylesterase [Armatimonadota bacterium]MDW8289085.1 chemotaxis response regulator protein-glutamate methylesterase [Armatimonadota bacterium]